MYKMAKEYYDGYGAMLGENGSGVLPYIHEDQAEFRIHGN
jgi:hypothetical protein